MFVMSVVEPEALMPKDYREEEVDFIIRCVERLLSVGVLAYKSKSYGLSRLLRYICFNPKTQSLDVSKEYLDVEYLSDQRLHEVFKRLEERLSSNAGKSCFLIDGLNSYNIKNLLSVLVSLRKTYKSKVCFVLGVFLDEGESINSLPKEFNSLVAGNYFYLQPLKEKDLKWAAQDMAKQLGVKVGEKEINNLINESKGNLLYIKTSLTLLINKFNSDRNLEPNSLKVPKLHFKEGLLFLDSTLVEDVFTKKEAVVLKLLIAKLGLVVSRDEIAQALSPKSLGEGVSNESIDQIIFRLKRKLKDINCDFSIKSVRGRGYIGNSKV